MLVSRSLFHEENKFWAYFAEKRLKIFLIVSSKLILISSVSYEVLFSFLTMPSNCSLKFLLILLKYMSKFSEIIFEIFQNFPKKFLKFSKILLEIFAESISWKFPKYFSKMFEKLMLTLDNISLLMHQLPMHNTTWDRRWS